MRACYNSKELHPINVDERIRLQKHLLKMYKEVEKVCDRHGLRLMVAYGTVLGAHRHQGFIPWDDDLDIMLPREDYNRLINDFADELPEKFKIFAPNSKNKPIYRFAKIVDTSTRVLHLSDESNGDETKGIYLDVFPLENAPKSVFKCKIRRVVAMALMLIASSVQEAAIKAPIYKRTMCAVKGGRRTYYTRKIIGKCFSFLSMETWFNLFDKFAKYNKLTGYYNIPSDGPSMRDHEPRPISLYVTPRKVVFEDTEVYVPNDIEEYLEREYGDWAWIPPVEERWQHFVKEIKFNI